MHGAKIISSLKQFMRLPITTLAFEAEAPQLSV
jgi:hypothetical protein